MAIGKKYATKFQVNLMPMSILGFLVGIKTPGLAKETSLTTICPVCDTPTKVSQFYQCPAGHGPFKVGDCAKAKEITKGTFVKVDKNQIKELGTSELEPNVLDLTVHRAAEVDAQMYPSDAAYVLYPDGSATQYGVLLEMIDLPDLAFIGLCNLQNHEKLLRLGRWGDNLVVQTMLHPADLSDRESVPVKRDGKYEQFKSAMVQFVEGSIEDFDPTAYTNARREKLLQLQASDGQTIVTSAPKVDADEAALERLMELLQSQKKGA